MKWNNGQKPPVAKPVLKGMRKDVPTPAMDVVQRHMQQLNDRMFRDAMMALPPIRMDFGGMLEESLANTMELPPHPAAQPWKNLKHLKELVERAIRDDQGRSWNDTDMFTRYIANLPKLGNGYFSTVFALNSRYVLKIVGSKGDKGYAAFADKCLENKGHPNLPRILYRGNWGGRDVYILERLVDDFHKERRNFVEAIRFLTDTSRADNPLLTITINCPTVKACFELLKGMLRDMKRDNVMARKDGTIVVTDPHYDPTGM